MNWSPIPPAVVAAVAVVVAFAGIALAERL